MTTEPAESPPVEPRRPGRPDPPAQLAKIATAGMSGVFVFGLAAVMGWSERSGGEPDLVPPVQPAVTALVPLATTIPAAPAPAAVHAPAPVTVVPVTPTPPPQAPVIVVSEQSQ